MSIRDNPKRKGHGVFIFVITVIVASLLIYIACEERFVFLLPGIVFLMFALVTIGLFCQAGFELGSRLWPSVLGIIRSARIVKSYVPAGGMRHAGNSLPRFHYSIDVDYDYKVGREWYKGSRISFVKKEYCSLSEAESAKLLLVKDKHVRVYYCPFISSCSCIAHVQIRDIVIPLCVAVTVSVVSFGFTWLTFSYLP